MKPKELPNLEEFEAIPEELDKLEEYITETSIKLDTILAETSAHLEAIFKHAVSRIADL